MRIAVLIIALWLTGIIGLQSCAMTVGDRILQQTGGGAAGIIVTILFVIGAGFVMAMPRVSIAVFALAAILGIAVGANTTFTDLSIWGGVAAVLAIMSYFGSRELSAKRREPPVAANEPPAP